MTPTVITATEIVYGRTTTLRQDPDLPVHPALAILDWDDDADRSDVHSVDVGVNPVDGQYLTCGCRAGFRMPVRSALDAAAAVISHALHSCAVCGGDKPATVAFGPTAGQMDLYPRCSACSF